MQKPHITFAGKKYGIETLLRNCGAAPLIEINVSELATDYEKVVKIIGEEDPGTILLYKYEGRYVALLGMTTVSALKTKGHTKIKGKLVSKQLLKHISIIDIPANQQNARADAAEERARENDHHSDGMNRLGDRFHGNFRPAPPNAQQNRPFRSGPARQFGQRPNK